MFALALGSSFAALLAGPLLVHWARGRAAFESAFAGLTVGLIPTLILARFLPLLAVEFGLTAAALFATGYFVAWWLESRAQGRVASWAPNFVTLALAAHGLGDGAALAVAFDGACSMTATAGAALIGALVAHKIPEGLFVASTLARAVGMRVAIWRVLLIGSATVTGGIGGRQLLQWAPEAAVHWLFAIGLGVLLRVVAHRRPDANEKAVPDRVRTSCFVAGVGVAIFFAPMTLVAWLAASLVLVVGLRETLGRLLRAIIRRSEPPYARRATKSVGDPQ
jgi:hypothetical protein